MKKLAVALAALAFAGSALAAEGSAVFAHNCVVCHGKDGKGSPAGQKLGAKDLTKIKDGEAEIAKVVAAGRGKMTAFKTKLSPEDIQAVAKYVKGLQK